jgi:hypothetical protein
MSDLDLISGVEPRLLALERRRLDLDLAALQRRLLAAEQGVWDAWADVTVPTGMPPAPVTCATSYSGTINGACGSTYLTGQTVTVQDHATHAVLGTATISAGAYSGSVMATNPSQVVDFVIAVTGYTTSTTTRTLMCGSNTVPPIVLALASGYRCVPGCTQPVTWTTLYTHDSVYGSRTLTWNGTDFRLCFTAVYPGSAPTCAAGATIAITYVIANTGFHVEYTGGLFGCPGGPGTCPGSPNVTLTGTITASVCPGSHYAASTSFGSGNGGSPIFGPSSALPVTVNIADTPI